MGFGGYGSLENIHSGSSAVVYRARREQDDRPVILKALRSNATRGTEERFGNEIELTQAVAGPGVVEVFGLETHDGRPVLVLEDFGGRSLRDTTQSRRLGLKEALQIGVAVAETLARLHRSLVIHKDISPANVVWNEQTGQIKLIDFGISSAITRERPELVGVNVLEGTLDYMSPEQSGRMNRSVDHRSDLYSLGAMLYELLTGRAPFSGSDALELIHAHMALTPAAPHELDSSIPKAVSAIVLKLLAKSAEERYQGAGGALADLRRVLDAVSRNAMPEPFSLGSADVAERLRIPEKLYGRHEQTTTLFEAFQRACAGALEIVLVSGTPGIGKTRMVNEIHRPVVERNAAFISGKFDQFRRGIPYESLAQAFRRFVRQLLTERDEVIDAWRKRLQAVLGDNGALIVDVIPELELVVGEQPEVAALPPNEAENRFHIAFRRFSRSLASAEQPLVLFLDDLQWADLPTLQLLTLMATDREAGHLLIVGAYRDNEVDGSHPLRLALDDIEKSGREIATLELGPLPRDTVRELLADALYTDAEIDPLADLVHEKTHGNPFFVNQFLEGLYSREYLRFDAERRAWTWAIDDIRAAEITDNVVEFMAERLGEFDEEARGVLGCAALVGNRFDLTLVATAMGIDPADARRIIAPALTDALVLEVRRGRFEFQHDRVQQAAAALVGEERRLELHHAIGRQLLEGMDEVAPDEGLFEVTRHLNLAASRITDEDERRRLARLNLVAGERARDSAAYAPALEYLQIGLDLSGPEIWKRDRTFALDIHLTAAEAAFLATEFDRMDALCDTVLEQTDDVLERVKVYEVRINAIVARNDLVGAIETALEILAELDVSLPADPNPGHVVLGLVRTKWTLRGRSMDDLAGLPRCTDAKVMAAMRLQMGIVSAAYYARPNLMPLLAFSLIRQAVAHGIGQETPYAFCVWGLVQCTLNDFSGGVEYGELALRLRDRIESRRLKTRAEHVFGAHLLIYKEHYRESRALLRRTYQQGYDSGDLEYCAFSAMMSCAIGLHSGEDLVSLAREMTAFSQAITGLSQATSLYTHEMHRQMALTLQTASLRPWELRGEAYDETTMVPLHEEASDQTNLFTYRALRVWLSAIYGRWDEAHAAALHNRKHMDAAASTVILQNFVWHDALVAMYVGDSGARRRTDKAIKLFEKWNAMQPANTAHKIALLRAERARAFGPDEDVAGHYDRAVRLANAQGFLNDAALAAELAARHFLQAGIETTGRAYLREALHAWTRWGAHAKAEALADEFPSHLSEASSMGSRRASGGTTRAATSTGGVNLDAHAVVRASEAISREIVLDRVVEALLRIAVEAAGARKALLILVDEEGLRVAAEARVDAEVVVEALDLPLDEHEGHPDSVIRYTQRSGETVHLADASRPHEFGEDPHLASVRSVLCVPVMQKSEVEAILYLEHELASGVFTDDRVELLRVLVSQAAISLENARLYGNLRRLADAQARFVPTQFLQNLQRTSIVNIGLGENVRKHLSVLFSDIRGFTPLVEGMSPQEHIGFINSYLSHMEPSILGNGGFVDSYIGDAIMALFDGEHAGADEAMRAGIGMSRALEQLNAVREKTDLPPIRMGVGINSGTLTLGTIGGPERIKCGVIGSAVNLAARVESLTKTYDTAMLISNHTRDQLEDASAYVLRAVDRVYVKGSNIPVTLFEVVDAEPARPREAKQRSLETFERAVTDYYARRFSKAAEGMRACLAEYADDRAPKRYLERCEKLAGTTLPDDWDGVVSLDHK